LTSTYHSCNHRDQETSQKFDDVRGRNSPGDYAQNFLRRMRPRSIESPVDNIAALRGKRAWSSTVIFFQQRRMAIQELTRPLPDQRIELPSLTTRIPAVAAVSRSPYFVNWWVDASLIGGLSIITWLGLQAFYTGADTKPLVTTALVLSLFVNFPHFSATVYRLYQNTEHMRQFPVTAWGLPFIIFGAVFACFWQPEVVAPYFLLLFFFWSPYHYSGQTVGITMVYARRCGFPIGRWERVALSAFVYSAFVFGAAHVQENGLINYYGMSIPILVFPAWMEPAALAVMWIGAVIVAGFVVAWCRAQRRVLPPIVLLPAIAHFIWFVPGASLKSFLIVVPLFHSLQYLLIALVVQLKLRIDAGEAGRSWRRVRVEALRWGARNVAGGVLLFIGIPVCFAWLPLSLLTIFGIVAAAVNVHHFFVDGVIWKLRDASNSSALMINIAELGSGASAEPVFPRPVAA
jgi:hypothetical protein